jgi:hypothetical protein
MPDGSDIERRDQAVSAFILLTDARDRAVPSLRRKHLDVAGRQVLFDAREVQNEL